MSLTLQQQAAAYATHSVAAIAGAGTGKTHMLAERYLYHLRVHQLSPLEIVTATYTEKAAAELRSRIRSSVTKELPDGPDLLAELEAAQISTIHALAVRICREHPQVADVPPDFTVLDELEGVLLSEQWFGEALNTLPLYLYEQVPYTLMSEALRSLLKDPIVAQRALARGTEYWQQLAQELKEKALRELLNHAIWQQAKDTLQTHVGRNGDKLELETRQPALQAMDALEAGENPKEALEVIEKLKINCGSKKNWSEGAFELVKDTIKHLRKLVEDSLNAGLITLELSLADEQLASMLPALREAFGMVQDYLWQAKRRARVLDFADLEVCALQALQDSQVQSYYDQRWRAFLIDEFQDTNPVQSSILDLLTKDALLTIVGDAKQSIYGFRRADVEVFRSWCDRIKNSGGSEEILSTSFRTHQPLVEKINKVFAPILGALHQDLEGNRKESPNTNPAIQVYTVQAESGINKSLRLRVEARHIAELLKQMLESKTLVHDKKTNQLRPVVPGDIAILSRTWEPLEIYGEALESTGIPVALGGGGNLLDTREAKDGWALLRFLADKRDDLALVAVLRSPFFAVSDRILFAIAQLQEMGGEGDRETRGNEEDAGAKMGWWEKLQTVDIPELRQPVQVLSQLLRDRNIEPPTRLLQMADHLTGYTAVIANLPGAARREADWRGFLELVRQIEQGNHDVFAVVRRLKMLAASEVEIPRLPLAANNAVALMTIHAAKGLEWSVVVVPDLTRSRPVNSQPLYFDPKDGVALKLEDNNGDTLKPVLYVWLEHKQKQRERAEALRVLYVALTRARDQLILTAADETGGGLDILQPGLESAGIPIEVVPFQTEFAQPPIPPEPPLLPESQQLLVASVGSGLFELPVTALSEYAQCSKRFYYHFIQGHPGIGAGAGTAQRVGTLVHLALERNIRDIDTLATFDVGLERESVEEALRLAQRFDEVTNFAPFREQLRQWEKPVTLSLGRLTLNGVVDLLGSNWILDFKTDREIEPLHHRFQLWAYAQATGCTTAHIAYLRHDYLYTFSEADLTKTAREAQILVQNILDGHYLGDPSHSNCRYCPYAKICDERYQGVEDTEEEEDTETRGQGDTGKEETTENEEDTAVKLLSSQISSYFDQVIQRYYRLIVVVVPHSRSQTLNFCQIAEFINSRYVNINLELSWRLLELRQSQKATQVQKLLAEIIGNTNNGAVFLDRLEILFDESLKLKPLECLQKLARDRTIVAVWNGSIENNSLIYAESGHPEYCRCLTDDCIVVNL